MKGNILSSVIENKLLKKASYCDNCYQKSCVLTECEVLPRKPSMYFSTLYLIGLEIV